MRSDVHSREVSLNDLTCRNIIKMQEFWFVHATNLVSFVACHSIPFVVLGSICAPSEFREYETSRWFQSFCCSTCRTSTFTSAQFLCETKLGQTMKSSPFLQIGIYFNPSICLSVIFINIIVDLLLTFHGVCDLKNSWGFWKGSKIMIYCWIDISLPRNKQWILVIKR